MFYFFFVFSIFFLNGSEAFAWGPATHLELGMGALAQSALFLPWIKRLVDQYSLDFLYGSVAADITIGKALVPYARNCHNWDVALGILDSAPKDHQKAFMLGYLGHLAADTVSHNYFVPFYTAKSFRHKGRGHTYWEVRMDAHAPREIFGLLRDFEGVAVAENDMLLASALEPTLFSFKTNKRIFKLLLALQQTPVYQRLREGMRRGADSERAVGVEAAHFFKGRCEEAVRGFLSLYDQAPCLKADPTGMKKIGYAREVKRALKHSDKRGLLLPDAESALFSDLDTAFLSGLSEPILLPELKNYT